MSSGPQAADPVATLPRHLYVHVPLCRAKCSYCDFYSLPAALAGMPPESVALHLLRQAVAWKARGAEVTPLRSLYVGGGTPTMLGSGLPFLVESLCAQFGVEVGAEVTIEANPDSLDAALVRMLAACGVTRVSLGVQSFDDTELRALGRAHDAAAARAAAEVVLAEGLELSIDLMCGTPLQTAESWSRSLDTAASLGCNHVSVYPLSLEEGTPLTDAVERGEALVPGEDAVAEMLETAAALLEGVGLPRYEVANFARPGHESVHNSAYWTGAEYLAVGPSAHGMLSAHTARVLRLGRFSNHAARVRYAVAADLWEGLEEAPPLELEILSEAECGREDAMLGLRTARGISEGAASDAGVEAVLRRLEAEGLVEHVGERWRLAGRGWLLGNEVFGRVWLGDNE